MQAVPAEASRGGKTFLLRSHSMKFFRKKTCLKILLPLVFLAAASVAVPAAGFDRALQDLPSEDTSVSATQSSAVAARENAARELSQLCETYFVAGRDSLSSDEAWEILELWAAATGENPPNRSEAWLRELTGMRDAGTAARCFDRTLGRRAAETRAVTTVLRNEASDVTLRRRVAVANKISSEVMNPYTRRISPKMILSAPRESRSGIPA